MSCSAAVVTLFSFATCVWSWEEVRRSSDEEILASQRYFSQALREHYNKADFAFCKGLLTEDVVFSVRLGPAASDAEQAVGWKDPLIARGPEAVDAVWKGLRDELGLQDLKAFEALGGDGASSLVLDDDTVLAESRFAFDKARGRIHWELWVRKAEEWKLRSSELELEELLAPLGIVREEPVVAASAAAAPPHPAREAGALASGAEAPEASSAAEEVAEEKQERSSSPAPSSAAPDDTREESSSSSHSSSRGPLLLFVLTPALGCATLMVHRSRRRKQAIIAGFEEMLG